MLRSPVLSIKTFKTFAVILATALLMTLAAACGSDPTATAPASAPTSAATAAPTATPVPAQPTEQPETAETPIEGHQPTAPPATTAAQPAGSSYEPSREGEELNVILATTVLEPGPQRVAFLLTTGTGLVKDSNVQFTPVYLPGNDAGEEIATSFNEWPYGTRGTFAAEVDFDRPGLWRLDIVAEGPDATGWGVQEIEVLEQTPIPALGSAGPLSENKTLGEFGDIELVTTDYSPDESLYQITVKEAVESPLPAVVVFASPAFCTTATCGPQVDAVSELREAYDGQAHFIHVEIYDNPDEIQGDLTKARISPVVDEWGMTQLPHWFNESWTFVLDAGGIVKARFEGFATVMELEEALQGTLN